MAQENAPNKPVHLMYFCSGLLLFYILQWTVDWIWGYFSTAPSELFITIGAAIVALAASIIAYRHERLYQLSNEVASELKKVVWPGAKDVRSATIIVMVMTLISATVLGTFDLIFANITDLIYG